MKTLFHFTVKIKIINIITLSLFFIFILLIFGFYFLIKIFYGKNSLILFDICKNNIKGCIFMSLIYGLRNIILGFVHLFNSKNVIFQFCNLSFIEGLSLLFFTKQIYSSKKLLNSKILIWGYAFISLEQILLNFTFIFNYFSED